MFDNIKILWHQGKQFIPDVRNSKIPGIFKGRPVISKEKVDVAALLDCCPTDAIGKNPTISIDMGKCTFCGTCALKFPQKIRFTTDYKIAANSRERLIISEGEDAPLLINPALVRPEIRSFFKGSLKLRQISAAGDNSCEWELNAANNVQFDMGRFGIE